MSRADIRKRIQATLERGDLLFGAAAGAGLFAEAAQRGGADFLVAVSAGRLRLMGAATAACVLPVLDSNGWVTDFGVKELVSRCSIPVIFGAVAMTSKQSANEIADHVAALGFAGVANFPSAAHYPRAMSDALEACGLGFRKELTLLRAARAVDLWTVCWVRDNDHARQAAASGADMVCLDYGWTAGGWHGAQSAVSVREAALFARQFVKTVRNENPEAIPVVAGGPIERIEDFIPIFRSAHVAGYIGGSTLDRLLLEDAVMNQTLRFKNAAAMTRKQNAHHRTLVTFGRSLGLVGTSQRMLELYRTLQQAARVPARLAFAISGEAGTGRQFLAEALFRLRGGRPSRLKTIDASAMPPQRLMVALFGRQESGSERAIGGVAGKGEDSGLIVRGLENVSAHTQKRVARFLAKGTFRRVGDKREQSGAAQLLFVSSKSVHALEQEGTLQTELARELGPREIAVPALRDYVEDLEEILIDMVRRLTDISAATPKVSPAALHRLQVHPWPGNLTELRAFAMSLAATITAEHVDDAAVTRLLLSDSTPATRPASERDVILDALWRHGFHRGRTARFLGIARRTLFNKIQRYRLGG